MSELQPSNTDAILGGQNPPPFNAAVLGGIVGLKLKIVHEWGLSEELVDRFSFETITVNDRAEIIDRQKKETVCYTVDINGVPLELVYIPAGSFLMGGFNELVDPAYHKVDRPVHIVTLQSFFIGKYPVTQKQYLALMSPHRSYYQENDVHPITFVSWKYAMKFCQRLSDLIHRKITLPSESQWEYACRAGTDTYFYFGKKINTDLVNFADIKHFYDFHLNDEYTRSRFKGKTTPVGIYPPNYWGLYDMHGNVREYCLDTHHDDYIGAPSDGSAWIDVYENIDNNSKGMSIDRYTKRVDLCCTHPVRGGAFDDPQYLCTSYRRSFAGDDYTDSSKIGFRICMVLDSDNRHSSCTS